MKNKYLLILTTLIILLLTPSVDAKEYIVLNI